MRYISSFFSAVRYSKQKEIYCIPPDYFIKATEALRKYRFTGKDLTKYMIATYTSDGFYIDSNSVLWICEPQLSKFLCIIKHKGCGKG
jgi:hypothetical protein